MPVTTTGDPPPGQSSDSAPRRPSQADNRGTVETDSLRPVMSPTEEHRLAALRSIRILDSLPDAFSESVALAAASLANMPMSAISLIDADRQWFKGACGLEVRETPREVSFCAHTLLQAEPLIVPDTRLDGRFSANPLVTSAPHVRFYAGFPLLLKGQQVGALCVLDDRPRQLDAAQIAELRRLAAGTSAWLEGYRHRAA